MKNWLILTALVFLTRDSALGQQYAPLVRSDFKPMVANLPGAAMPQGFGDRQNGWAWSMAWFKGKLYVGTARAYHCTEQAALNKGLPDIFPYPPPDPDVECTPDMADLPLRAEIWAHDPAANTWVRVFQSPEDIPVPDAPGKFTARDIGFRAAHVHREPDGTEALYFSGVSSRFIWGTTNAARILRTTDGITFTPIPQRPGTVMGDLGNASFRGMTSYKGRLYVIAGSITGSGVLMEAFEPKLGNNAWRQVSAPDMEVYEIETFNGYLYLGLYHEEGLQLVKTDSTGVPPYNYTTVIPRGAYRTSFPNRNFISMKRFRGRLYAGGNGVRSWFGAELYRVNPDDTWELLSGRPRETPQGLMEPLTGLGPGFGWVLNAHMWRQHVFDGRLYIGTFDMSTTLKELAVVKNLIAREMGFDLWTTTDGVYFTPVDEVGFQDKFNFGARTMETTPYGLYLGTANYYYGLQIFRAIPFGFTPPTPVLAAPQRLDVETTNGKVLLTWDPAPGATSYRILRSTFTPSNALQKQGVQTLWVPGQAVSIGTTDKPYYYDANAMPGGQYGYYVVAADSAGQVSGRSNWNAAPSQAAPVTFAQVQSYLNLLAVRKKFTSPQMQNYVMYAFSKAKADVLKGDLTGLFVLNLQVRRNLANGAAMLDELSAEDLELLLNRILKRSRLYQVSAIPATAL
jgi:hypothetical protein